MFIRGFSILDSTELEPFWRSKERGVCGKLSKAENPADDAKKLAQRCKALEAQLRQTITKKEHHEIVLEFEDKITGMEKTVSGQDRKLADQEKELARARAELQRNAGLGKQVADVGAQLASLAKTVEAQGRTADSLLFKVSQGTVPAAVHQQSLSKAKELEEQVGGMVGRAEYAALQRRFDEATARLGDMVPSSDYEAVKGRVQELEAAISSMVPREQLESSESTVRELKTALEEHVPQSAYDELVSKVVQLAEEVTGGGPSAEEEPVEHAEPTGPAEPSPAEPAPIVRPVVPAAPLLQEAQAQAAAPAPPPSPGEQADVPEIREVGSKLAELKTEAFAEESPAAATPAKTDQAQEPPAEKSELTPIAATSAPDSDSQDYQT